MFVFWGKILIMQTFPAKCGILQMTQYSLFLSQGYLNFLWKADMRFLWQSHSTMGPISFSREFFSFYTMYNFGRYRNSNSLNHEIWKPITHVFKCEYEIWAIPKVDKIMRGINFWFCVDLILQPTWRCSWNWLLRSER